MGEYRNITTLDGIEITGREDLRRRTVIHAKWAEDRTNIDVCRGGCGTEDPHLVIKEWPERPFRDRPVGDRPLEIQLKRCRYECNDCKGTFKSEHEGLKDNSNMTTSLVEHLRRRSIKLERHKDAARSTGVDESTVRKYFRRHLRKLDEQYSPAAPKFMGIDAVHVGSDERYVVITSIGKDEENNAEEGEAERCNTVVEMLKSPSKNKKLGEALRDYLNKTKFRVRTEAVVMDMDSEFRKAVREALPHTSIIVDRFHITKRVNLALGNVKSWIVMNKKVNSEKLEKKWEAYKKKLKEELKARRKELEEEFEENYRIKNTEQLAIEPVQNIIDDAIRQLELSFWAKERFLAIFNLADSREEADIRFERWEDNLPEKIHRAFSKLCDTLDNWRNPILNYFEHRYTNAYNEKINSVIKSLERKGLNYSFETIRAKIIYGLEHRKEIEDDTQSILREAVKHPPREEPQKVDHGVPFENVIEEFSKK